MSKTEAEMLKTKNFGRKSLNEIKEILSNMGLSLGMKVDEMMAASGMGSNNPIKPQAPAAPIAPAARGNGTPQ